MKVIIPDVSKPDTFRVNPDSVKEICFLFVPVDKGGNEYVYLMSLTTLKDNPTTIRLEPRYFEPEIFQEFLANTGLERLYELLLNALQIAQNISDVSKQFQYLQESGLMVCESRKPSDCLIPAYYNDYTKCKLYNYEPKTLVNIDDKVIDEFINKLQSLLPSDREV